MPHPHVLQRASRYALFAIGTFAYPLAMAATTPTEFSIRLSDSRARGWAASLNHNIGWTYFSMGEPATALTYWKKELPLREASSNKATTRVAKWTIARGYRTLGQLDDAEAMQMALATETERDHEPDGYIYEELAEIALARGNGAGAAPWAAKAHALLKGDGFLKANEAARLQRLAQIAQGNAK